jgi:protein TonB
MSGKCPGSYPAAALRRGVQGRVVLRIRVAPDGTPTDVRVLSSSHSDLLDNAAADAVRNCHHFPIASQAGQRVAYDVDAPYTFIIQN